IRVSRPDWEAKARVKLRGSSSRVSRPDVEDVLGARAGPGRGAQAGLDRVLVVGDLFAAADAGERGRQLGRRPWRCDAVDGRVQLAMVAGESRLSDRRELAVEVPAGGRDRARGVIATVEARQEPGDRRRAT